MKLIVNMLRSESATVIAKASDAPTYKSLLRTLESVAPKAAIRIMAGGKRNHGITDAGVFVGTKNSEGAYYLVGSAAFALAMAEDFKSVAKKAKTEGKFIVWEATDDGLPGKSPVNVAAYNKWADALADFVGRGDGTAGASAAPIVKENAADLTFDGIVAKILELEPDGYGPKSDVYLNKACGTNGLEFNDATDSDDSAITINGHLKDRMWFIIGDSRATSSLGRELRIKSSTSTFFALKEDGIMGDYSVLVAEFKSDAEAAAALPGYLKKYQAGELPQQKASATFVKGPISLDDMDFGPTSDPFSDPVSEDVISPVQVNLIGVNSDIAISETDLNWLHDEIGVVDSDKSGDRLGSSKQIVKFIWRSQATATLKDYLYSIDDVGGSTAVIAEPLIAALARKPRTRLVLVTKSDVPKKIKPLMKNAKVAIFSVKVNSSGAIQGTPTRVYAARNLPEGLKAMMCIIKATKAQAK